MTNEQALSTLRENDLAAVIKKIADKRNNDRSKILHSHIQAIKISADALEKQIPKKPELEVYFYSEIYYCSLCKKQICKDNVFVPPAFCKWCGQAIDWW